MPHCAICLPQKNISSPYSLPGLLQPLPVTKGKYVSCSKDSIMNLPFCYGYNARFTCVGRLTKYCKLIPCFTREGALTASLVANLFFSSIVGFFGIPAEVILGTPGSLLTSGGSYGFCWGPSFWSVIPPIEKPLFPGLYLIIVNNYKTIIVPNNSLNPAHPIAVAQAKPQPKDQMRVVLPFKLTAICRPKCACLT